MNQTLRCDGSPGGQDGTLLVAPNYVLRPARENSPKPYNKSFSDQACSVKMTGYWPRSFFLRVYAP